MCARYINIIMKSKYYEAYDNRYKTIHNKGYSWSSDKPTPIVLDVINRYQISKQDKILEIGCGEGRDARLLLDNKYNLLATDISKEAIRYCQNVMKEYKDSFMHLDCLNDNHEEKYKFIYAIALLHMLVLDDDRKRFYEFIYNHLDKEGIALICSMGDGETIYQSDVNQAFDIVKREHPSGDVMVTSTSCRMVNFNTFVKEIEESNFEILEKGITSSLPDFNNLMYAVIKVK